jgi:Fe2+ or Zn2+ uptake regulation protein
MARLKRTRQREQIIAAIPESKAAMSAQQVYEALCSGLPTLAKSTVYRNLNMMTAEGLIRRVYMDGMAKYEAALRHRHYLTCLKCGATTTFDECPIRDFEDEVSRDTGFSIAAHNLELFGYCPRCKNHKDGE